ncbi:SDR family NAD(P)-dependent oxidoreductase, partial [Dactylosporangium sp. NPDC049742]|uniref:SDR family NAD(P)-dependent oxidoreductase n=1 Tax=Dactylosporangium sp. NPDC049742 TaxID=3154737 RepID=UPI00343D51F2
MRTILITGATSGVGYATAAALAGPGTHLVLTGRDPDRLAAARARLLPAGGAGGHRPGPRGGPVHV